MLYMDEFGNELDISLIPKSRLCSECEHQDTRDEMQQVCCVGIRFKHMENPAYRCGMFQRREDLSAFRSAV
jgi:hypothetical protein